MRRLRSALLIDIQAEVIVAAKIPAGGKSKAADVGEVVQGLDLVMSQTRSLSPLEASATLN